MELHSLTLRSYRRRKEAPHGGNERAVLTLLTSRQLVKEALIGTKKKQLVKKRGKMLRSRKRMARHGKGRKDVQSGYLCGGRDVATCSLVYIGECSSRISLQLDALGPAGITSAMDGFFFVGARRETGKHRVLGSVQCDLHWYRYKELNRPTTGSRHGVRQRLTNSIDGRTSRPRRCQDILKESDETEITAGLARIDRRPGHVVASAAKQYGKGTVTSC
jgi:hypothetical protein